MADYVITGPDGKEYDVSADSPEALNHAVQQMYGAPGAAPAPAPSTGGMAPSAVSPAPPAAPAERSFMDTVKGALDTAGGYGAQGLIGVRKGVSAIAGLPVDLASLVQSGATWAVNKATGAEIPYPTNPVGGSGTMDNILAAPARMAQAATGAPQEDTKPRSTGEAITRRVGEEIGATAIPAVAALAKARAVGVEGARQLPGIQRMFVEPAAVAPQQFAKKEASAAVAAGTGAGVVNTMLTDKAKNEAQGLRVTPGQQMGDLGGAVAGLGVAGLGKTAAGVSSHLLDAFRGKGNTAAQVVRDAATDEIVKAAGLAPDPKSGVANTTPLADKIRDGRRVDEAIPGFQESTADRLQDPGMAALEYGRQSGPNSGMYAQRRNANTEAVVGAVDKSAPGPQATPGAFSGELELERGRRITDAGVTRQNAEADAATAVRPLAPQGTPGMRGNTIRGELDTVRDTARQATRDAYDNADINGVPLSPTHLAEALDRTTAGLSHVERSMAPQGLIDRVAQMPAGEPTTLREATSLRTILLDQQRAAAAEPGRRYEARVLGQYIDAVEDVIGQNVSPAQRAALDEARVARRTEADSFERKGDPVAQATARFEGGVPKMRDENVATLSTRPDAMTRILQEVDTPATREAIRNQLLSNADTSSAEGIARFTRDNAEQLQRFPGLSDELNRAQGARTAEGTARQAESDVIREHGQGGRSVVARYLEYGDENATKAMRGVMANKDPARAADDLLKFVNDDPKAIEGARKVFWDILQNDTRSHGGTTRTTSGVQPYLPGRLQSFLDDPAKMAVAERLYRENPEHLANIRKVSEAMQGVDVRNSGKAANTSGTAQSILPTGETIASRVFAVQRGVVSPAFAAINIAGIIARKAMRKEYAGAVDKAIDQALLDPKFAELLLRENNPANRAAMRRGAQGWKGHEASTIVEMLSPDDPDAELKKAATR